MRYLLFILLILNVAAPRLFAQQELMSSDSVTFGKTYEEQDITQAPDVQNFDDVMKTLVYPECMKTVGIQGQVWMKVLVSEEGKVVAHKVKQSVHPGLSDACIAVLKEFRYKPGVLAGKNVKVWMTIPFNFKIEGVKAEKLPLLDFAPIALNLAEVAAKIELPKKCRKQCTAPCIINIMAQVDPTGKLLRFVGCENKDTCLFEAVQPHLALLKFAPAQSEGKAVQSWAKVVLEIQ